MSGSGFFGRRIGKPLRTHQSELMRDLLPQLSVDLEIASRDPRALFPSEVSEVFLEIGFGGGEHLTALATAHPDIGFIGCEAFVNGVAKLLHVIEDRGFQNVRIHPADALELLPNMAAHSVARLYVLYPDPWPKVRQRKRRIISETFLQQAHRILKPGAEFRFATDIDDYSAWTLSRVLSSNLFEWSPCASSDWTEPWPDWTRTRYEAKAIREGRRPAYFRFRRKAD